MGTQLKQKPEATLYDNDFCLWAQETAEAVRSGELSATDKDHIADELVDMARRDERELKSRTRNVIHHLLKWQYQPGRRGKSWQSTILRDRSEIEDLLDQSPSLRYYIHDHLDRVYQQAVRLAISDTRLESDVFPASCPYNLDRILDLTFFPDYKECGEASTTP